MQNTPRYNFLSCCDDPLPAEARTGIELFNRGHFFECHEALEDAWRRELGPCRLLYQAILQLGVALYHVQKGNTAGARKVLMRARKKLDQLPEVCQGVQIGALQSYARDLAAILARDGAAGVTHYPHIHLQEPGVNA